MPVIVTSVLALIICIGVLIVVVISANRRDKGGRGPRDRDGLN